MMNLELLKKMLAGAQSAAPTAPPLPTDIGVKEPSPDVMASLAQPATPAAPVQAGQPVNLPFQKDTVTSGSSSSDGMKDYTKTTKFDPSMIDEIKRRYGDAEKLLNAPGIDPTAMAGAQERDRNRDFLKNIGLATSTLAKATSGNKVNGDAFWNQLGGPSAVDRLKAEQKDARGLTLEKAKALIEGAGTLGRVADKEETLHQVTGESTDKAGKSAGVGTKTEVVKPPAGNSLGPGATGNNMPLLGFTQPEGAKYSADQIKQFHTLQKGVGRAVRAADGLLGYLGKYGNSKVIPDNDKADIEAYRQDLVNALKDKEGMGALQDAEIKLLEKTIGDPTSFQSFLLDAAGTQANKTKLETLIKLGKNQILDAAQTYKLSRNEKEPFYPGGTVSNIESETPLKGGMIGRKYKDGRKMIYDPKTGKETPYAR